MENRGNALEKILQNNEENEHTHTSCISVRACVCESAHFWKVSMFFLFHFGYI